jgi:ComEC/Rec2-related protein
MRDTQREIKRGIARWRRSAPAVQLALSVAVGQFLVWVASDTAVALLLLILGASFLMRHHRGLGGVAAGLVLGIVTAWIAVDRTPAVHPDDDAIIQGVLRDAPRRPIPGEIIFLLEARFAGKPTVFRCRAVDLPWRNAAQLEEGDEVVVRGSIAPVERPRNPFSWQGSLWRQHIQGECRARFVSQASSRRPSLLAIMRRSIESRVTHSVGDSGSAGLVLSMALGYHDQISVQIEQAFKRLGLTHLLVVSGYQVSLIFGFVSILIRYLLRGLGATTVALSKPAQVVSLVAAGLYVVCIGAEMSAVRALVAASCITAQLCSERGTSFAQRWGVALFCLQLIWPWCIFEIGVILTFAALCGIGIGLSLGAASSARAFVWVNVAVWICTSLVLVVWRGSISPLGLLVNLVVAAPWSIINCTVGLLGIAGVCLHMPGAATLLGIVAWCNEKLSLVVLSLADLPCSAAELRGMPRVLTGAALCIALLQALRACYSRSVVLRAGSGGAGRYTERMQQLV